MHSNKGIEVRDDRGNKFLLTLEEIQELLVVNLERNEVDELGGSVIIFAEFNREPVCG
jgi:hypothetical protein